MQAKTFDKMIKVSSKISTLNKFLPGSAVRKYNKLTVQTLCSLNKALEKLYVKLRYFSDEEILNNQLNLLLSEIDTATIIFNKDRSITEKINEKVFCNNLTKCIFLLISVQESLDWFTSPENYRLFVGKEEVLL